MLSTYIYREESGYDERFDAGTDEAAAAYAEQLLRDGDWGQDCADKTFTVRAEVARVLSDADPADRTDGLGNWQTVTFTFDPPQPPCPGREDHDWRDGPAYGSGGGVICTDTCTVCGLRRITDTWDHDPATGEVMTTVRYEASARP